MSTHYHSPYALIASGGPIPGQRQRTLLAFISNSIGGEAEFEIYVIRNGKTVKTPRWIPASSVLHKWRTMPTSAQIKKAKGRLIPA